MSAAAAAHTALHDLIRDIPDFPLPGVLFKDIGPVLGDVSAFRTVVEALAEIALASGASKVAGIEARGFLLAAPVGLLAGCGVVPLRKAGKLPGMTRRIDYSLEYGTATLEIQADAVTAGERVLIIDDVLATGGTARAAADLVTATGALVTGLAVLLELAALGGRGSAAPLDIHPLLVV